MEPTKPKIENDPEMEAQLSDEAKAQFPDQPATDDIPEHVAQQSLPQTEQLILPPKSNNKRNIIIALVIILVAAAGSYFISHSSKKSVATVTPKIAIKQPLVTTPAMPGLQLDPAKNYGNKYANGLLPVGDGKYVSDVAKAGYVYTCSGYASNLKTAQGGAGSRGPWFSSDNTQYDINKKLHVQGSVTWQGNLADKLAGTTRTITTNDLPNHATGTFPISASDPAYAYDRNPNTITSQSLSYALSSGPSYGDSKCMGGEAGVMLTGVALFNAFDAGGRDAGAWEIQDSCGGHPQKSGEYHYHTLSSCIKDTNVKTVIGFALDGFPITGPQVGANNILTTADLDECHGLTSQIVLDGKTVTSYHYVMTQDFPYSVSCFRATPVQPPNQPAGA